MKKFFKLLTVVAFVFMSCDMNVPENSVLQQNQEKQIVEEEIEEGKNVLEESVEERKENEVEISNEDEEFQEDAETDEEVEEENENEKEIASEKTENNAEKTEEKEEEQIIEEKSEKNETVLENENTENQKPEKSEKIEKTEQTEQKNNLSEEINNEVKPEKKEENEKNDSKTINDSAENKTKEIEQEGKSEENISSEKQEINEDNKQAEKISEQTKKSDVDIKENKQENENINEKTEEEQFDVMEEKEDKDSNLLKENEPIIKQCEENEPNENIKTENEIYQEDDEFENKDEPEEKKQETNEETNQNETQENNDSTVENQQEDIEQNPEINDKAENVIDEEQSDINENTEIEKETENNVSENIEEEKNSEENTFYCDEYDVSNPMMPKAWTIMMYMPYSEEEEIYSLINSLEDIKISENINLLLFYDGKITDYDEKDVSTLLRIENDVTDNRDKINSLKCNMESNDYNFGSSETLSSFINYTKTVYPAQKYGIIFRNTLGEMSAKYPAFAIAKDDESEDYLFIDEVRQCLETFFLNEKLEFAALDMNFASSLEYASELKTTVEYLGGVEGFADNFRFEYAQWLSKIDESCEDGKTALMYLNETYGSSKNRFAVLDLNIIDDILTKLNEISYETGKKLINQTQMNMVKEKYTGKINAKYYDYQNSDVIYYNLSDFVKKIRNKYYTILTDLDGEFQILVNQAVCNVEPKETKSWVFGKYPFSFCYSFINDLNEEIHQVPEKINNTSNPEDVLVCARTADLFYAGNNSYPSLIDRLVFEEFGGNENE